MIGIFGATGNIGKPLVEQLSKAGQAVRALTRDAKRSFPPGVEAVVGELNQKTIDAVVKGAEKIFLLVPPGAPPPTEDLILQAAKAAGVKHVVKLSSIGASGEKPQGLGVHHREREKILEASGLAWTMLRPGFFMSNALQWVPEARATGAVKNKYGDGKMYPIAPEDIAAVAALALTTAGHEGKVYELTGEHAITAPQEVELMSRQWARPVKVIDMSPEEGAAEARKNGVPERIVGAMQELWTNTRANKTAFHSDDARKVLGRPMLTFEQWCRANLPAL